ncbi:Uncharacterized protein TPAR_08412 [Tolypocladium paradoxum]|uniref:Uncharacterized protein n=1 Tax=Tolypocladium paradoxum TaxID=94208 RepID=A0A2S4KMF8_9HYPO|nr:Uncharacterized protein TPAR_08412 [Tolypocladium paradoxum]
MPTSHSISPGPHPLTPRTATPSATPLPPSAQHQWPQLRPRTDRHCAIACTCSLCAKDYCATGVVASAHRVVPLRKGAAELLVPIQEPEVKEDRCGSCNALRRGVRPYPTQDQVRIHGREHVVGHLHAPKYGSGSHCGTCGVSSGTAHGPPLGVFNVPPARLEHVMSVYHKNMGCRLSTCGPGP